MGRLIQPVPGWSSTGASGFRGVIERTAAGLEGDYVASIWWSRSTSRRGPRSESGSA